MNEKQKLEIEELKLHGMEYLDPVLTDPSCGRYRVGVKNDPTYYIFSQYEITEPKEEAYLSISYKEEMKLRTEAINLDDYSEAEKDDACEAFGVSLGSPSELVAEYLFELKVGGQRLNTKPYSKLVNLKN